jgi:DNA-binding transcriptional ArsR family regulator
VVPPDLMTAVAEPNRRRLLQLLGHGERTVTELAGHFTVSRSAISQHLGVLAEAGLVASRREGRFQYYSLNPAGLAALRAELDSFWTGELDRLVSDALSGVRSPRAQASEDEDPMKHRGLGPVQVSEPVKMGPVKTRGH